MSLHFPTFKVLLWGVDIYDGNHRQLLDEQSKFLPQLAVVLVVLQVRLYQVWLYEFTVQLNHAELLEEGQFALLVFVSEELVAKQAGERGFVAHEQPS